MKETAGKGRYLRCCKGIEARLHAPMQGRRQDRHQDRIYMSMEITDDVFNFDY